MHESQDEGTGDRPVILPHCFFQPPINHSRPKPPLFKIRDGDYQQEKRSPARAPKKNCCAIRLPKCPRLRKVQNENKCCLRKREINRIYHDNKQSFLFFFSLVHNVLLIFCFIQLHKRLENITQQTVKQQQKAKTQPILVNYCLFFFLRLLTLGWAHSLTKNTHYHHNRRRHCSSLLGT